MTFSGTNPTVLVPGFAGGNGFFRRFRQASRIHGIATVCWNRAPLLYRRPITWYGQRLSEDLLRLRRESKVPLTGVGWSEGGLILVSALQHLSVMGNPHDIVGHVITFAAPYAGTWAARIGGSFDRLLCLNVREMRPGSPTLAALIAFLHRPRRWKFHAISGTHDLLVPAWQPDLDPSWCQYGPWSHSSLFLHPGLFDLIHRLILLS